MIKALVFSEILVFFVFKILVNIFSIFFCHYFSPPFLAKYQISPATRANTPTPPKIQGK